MHILCSLTQTSASQTYLEREKEQQQYALNNYKNTLAQRGLYGRLMAEYGGTHRISVVVRLGEGNRAFMVRGSKGKVRVTLSKKIGVLLAVAFLANLVVSAIVLIYLEGASDEPRLLNRAGYQRMLTVQMQEHLAKIEHGHDEQRDNLLAVMAQYAEGLEAVGFSQPVGSTQVVAPHAAGQARPVFEMWQTVEPNLDAVARLPRDDARFAKASKRAREQLEELLQRSDEAVGVIEAHANKRRERTKLVLWSASAGYLVLWVVGVLMTRRRIVGPVRSLQRVAISVGEGDFTKRLPVEGGDELSVLASAFNEMSERVDGLLEDLRAEKQRFQNLVRHATDGIIIVDERDEIAYANPAMEQMLGRQVDALVGQPIDEIIEHGAAGGMEAARGVDDELDVMRCKGRHSRGSTVPLECTRSTYGSAAGSRHVYVLRDVTQRDKITAKLMHLDRLMAVGNLAAGVGHEVNNPLAFILPNIRWALGVMEEVPQAIEACGGQIDTELAQRLEQAVDGLQDAIDGAERIRRIVLELRGYAEQRNAPPQRVEVAEIVDTALRLVSAELPAGVQPTCACEPVASVMGIRPQLVQVIYNILLNAGQAIEATPGSAGQIQLSIRQDADQVVIEIEDDGEGIAPDDQPQIFDPFFSTRAVGQGTGLGLTIAHEIVSAHGGTIDVESRPAEGTRVRVRLASSGTVEDVQSLCDSSSCSRAREGECS